jgi:hypothetical protein
VTKKGTSVNKKRHFVDKTTLHVDEQVYLCGCLRYSRGAKNGRGMIKKDAFIGP